MDELISEWDERSRSRAPFSFVKNKLSRRSDLCAMLILDKLCPGDSKVISYVSDDEIRFGIELEKLVGVISTDDISDLCACGVFLVEREEYIGMFV